ncbi:sulfotransferase [Lysobacter sp. S4-A87]|uniref:tetratricopeptide repeat-containing sulfotransferase family protein n=1 Tax=Lysobacter sp. S4-A87 TaxID=2925843 RepID=UPI001F5342AA|nr:sulfotransferase [Lysobacter sp. S4-A87]UNK50371.1 sulfotransferase [Lysobacter sp. S4-A87]
MSNVAPSALQALISKAEALAASDDLDGAIAAFEQVLLLRPNEPYALIQLSYLNSLRGHYRRAEEHALAAARTGTTDPRLLAELLPRLRTFNQVPALQAAIDRAKPMSRMPIPLLIAAAAQLSYVNLPSRAIAFLDEARRADPDYPPTLLARAQVLTYLGRFSEAGQDIERSQRRAPEIAQGYWLSAWVRKQTAEANHIAAIERELKRPGRTAEDIALLAFALHKEHDDLGQHEAAWNALVLGCRAKRSRLNYDTGATAELFESLSTFEPAPPATSTGQGDDTLPIFIVGMHRSGTTLLEQLLDGHPDVRGLGELYDFTSAMRHATDHHCRGVIDRKLVERAAGADLAAAGERYLGSVKWRAEGRRCFTDKLPSNFLNIGFIAHALPQAKILHMVRDPVETCFSNLREMFSEANAYSYDPIELADYHRLYKRLMSHWHARFPGRILDVEYAKLVADPEGELRRVADFCGLPFDPAMLDIGARKRAVVTASAVQVRDSIQVRERPKWAPYEQWLAPMIERLQA